MAIRSRIRTGLGQQAIPDPIMVKKDGTVDPAGLTNLKLALQSLVRAYNGMISLGDGSVSSWAGNLDAQWIPVLFPSVADTEMTIPHGLGRLAVGYFVGRADRACSIYDSSAGSWNTGRIMLKSSVGSATVLLLVF